MSAPTWTGSCTGCHRDGLEVTSRRTHGERVLCTGCADRPYRMPSSAGMNAPMAPSWVGERVAVIDAATTTSGRIEYLSADSFGTGCWICGEALRVEFVHVGERLGAVRLHCTAGCAESDLAAGLADEGVV